MCKSGIKSYGSELLPPVSTYDRHVRTASFDHRRPTTRPTITLAAPHLHARDHPRVHDITAALTPPPNVETAADPLQHAHPSSVGRLRTSCAARARPGLMMSHAMPTTAKAPRVRCQQRKRRRSVRAGVRASWCAWNRWNTSASSRRAATARSALRRKGSKGARPENLGSCRRGGSCRGKVGVWDDMAPVCRWESRETFA